MKKELIAIVCCLMLTACGNSSGGSSKQGANHKPSLDVSLAIDGSNVKVTVDTDLSISAEHYGMGREDGEGHIHMYLDDNDKIGVKERVYEFEDLAPGHHKLKISLHNNDHTPYDVTQTKEFDIK
ncbi:hypothetical protein [Cohnella yongneupensis]|uniref:DUF4399 domain-containing protein n=1 Tax=Cohnella yongneupensis TaxID=425006 RepID=A0ABW0R1L5_9BACL